MMDKRGILKTAYYEQPYQKEKDYINELFLSRIYEKNTGVVFKGGTALSKFYGLPRFSDDLDFSLSKKDADGLISNLDSIVEDVSKLYPIKLLRKINKKDILAYEISVRGPLFEASNRHQHVKIEIDKNASVIEDPNTIRRNPKYFDLRPYLAVVMKENEILAEKIVALMFRHNVKARDLFDIYFMAKNGTEIKVSLIDRKMKEHGHVFTDERLVKRMDLIRSIWSKELYRLLPKNEFIDYKEARTLVMEGFNAVNLL
ncbi:MAG: nucleotidyl transferase AbiEii/AbiGii toxin family protein [Candidatus Micrarchaeota archaeon]|nr:nucleotidyl transferase AbiEii/AbiGii toxin family protein [Candidatus Micrarchaeota archaeon]